MRSNRGTILVIALYLPVDYGNRESAEEYDSELAFLEGLLESVEYNEVILLGDFNADLSSMGGRFSKKLVTFLTDNCLKRWG